MPDNNSLAHRLESAVESNEKYRSRARSISTLSATAAGALAAGLILTPAAALPKFAQVLGLISISLLIVATALCLAAGSASSYQADKKSKGAVLHRFEVWRIRTKPSPKPPTYNDLIEDAEEIQRGILRISSWGLWTAALAAIILVVSLTIATLSHGSSKLVTIELDAPQDLSSCPSLKQVFKGKIRDVDRMSSLALVPVVVSPAECGNTGGATLYLDKSALAIVG